MYVYIFHFKHKYTYIYMHIYTYIHTLDKGMIFKRATFFFAWVWAWVHVHMGTDRYAGACTHVCTCIWRPEDNFGHHFSGTVQLEF